MRRRSSTRSATGDVWLDAKPRYEKCMVSGTKIWVNGKAVSTNFVGWFNTTQSINTVLCKVSHRHSILSKIVAGSCKLVQSNRCTGSGANRCARALPPDPIFPRLLASILLSPTKMTLRRDKSSLMKWLSEPAGVNCGNVIVVSSVSVVDMSAMYVSINALKKSSCSSLQAIDFSSMSFTANRTKVSRSPYAVHHSDTQTTLDETMLSVDDHNPGL